MIDFGVLTELAAREGIERIGVGVVVRDTGGRILMIRRAGPELTSGRWEFPGSACTDGEDVEAGAARVLAERTGLAGRPLEYALSLDLTDRRGRRLRQFVFTTAVPDGTPIALAPDHDALQWADPDQLPATGDREREVIERLTGRPAAPGRPPADDSHTSLARLTAHSCFLVTDPDGRVLGMRSAADPAGWDFPGGDVGPDESPFAAALRQAREQLGLDLAAENPEVIARRHLVAVIHEQAGTDGPAPASRYVFDGGVLTEEQRARIRLDAAGHTEWRFETAHDWHALLSPAGYQRLLPLLRAHRSGTALYLEHPAAADQFEGVMVFVTDREGRLLMHHRDDKPGIAWPGYWTPIGGWREADETPQETAAREVLEEAGITVTGLRPMPGPHHELVHRLTSVLHSVWDGPEADLRLGDEGLAVRMVPLGEVPARKVPPYMRHYLPLLAGATDHAARSAS
ncbi:NUDIX hydrolase [Kitasatospora herbaricolor]|uniref:NUDIX domain-containing protein n=1 Tax=Kitasatospora herbaricolor TaxID=68217 RepID=A0ABZ1WHA2_9ACTN|nr:NUDIX domain-containing protein [Kitasatospora herbaricolor]